MNIEIVLKEPHPIRLAGVTEQESSPVVSEIDQRVVSELLRDLGSATEKATTLMQVGVGQRSARPRAKRRQTTKSRVKGRRDGDGAKESTGQLDLK